MKRAVCIRCKNEFLIQFVNPETMLCKFCESDYGGNKPPIRTFWF